MTVLESLESKRPSPPPTSPSLSTLPHDLVSQIISFLPNDSLLRLRSTCCFFASFIRQPTHSEWLQIEREPWCAGHLLTCGGCVRLRFASKFSFRTRTAPPEVEWHTKFESGGFSLTVQPAIPQYGLNPMGPGGTRAGTRFCNECGVRDLPGKFRYAVADVWDDEGEYWIRCTDCHKVGRCPQRLDGGLFIECYERGFVKEA